MRVELVLILRLRRFPGVADPQCTVNCDRENATAAQTLPWASKLDLTETRILVA